MTDRLERLVNLTATLLATRRPLTLDQLAERFEPPYPADKAARRRQFERDKETLRDLGIPITVEPLDLGGEQGYRIRPEDYYLPDPGLTPEERAALHVAVTAVRLGGDEAREGLRKLGGLEGAAADAPLAELGTTPALAELFDAVARRARITFDYRGEVRALEPYGVVLRWGHWYVVGHDRDRDAPRAFRVDRIDGEPEVGEAGAFEPPPDVDPAAYLRADPLTYGEDQPRTARVLVDDARRLGGRAARRGGRRRPPAGRFGGRRAVGGEPGGVPHVRARSARTRRGARTRRAAGRSGGLARGDRGPGPRVGAEPVTGDES